MPEPVWWTYFKTVAGTEDGATIAKAAEVTASQVSRWKSGKNRPDADKVVTFARNHSKSPIEALIACGFIRKDEVSGVVEIRTAATALSNQELIDEITDRLNRAAQQQEREQEQSPVNVRSLRAADEGPAAEGDEPPLDVDHVKNAARKTPPGHQKGQPDQGATSGDGNQEGPSVN